MKGLYLLLTEAPKQYAINSRQ